MLHECGVKSSRKQGDFLSGSQNSGEYDEMLIDAQSCFLQKGSWKQREFRKKKTKVRKNWEKIRLYDFS